MGDGLRVQLQLSQAVIVLHQSTVPVQVVGRTVLGEGRDKDTCQLSLFLLNLGSNQAMLFYLIQANFCRMAHFGLDISPTLC